jgi:tetratricopeptide (TPR) repeat protein
VRLGEIYLHLNDGQVGPGSAGGVLGFSQDNQQASAASLATAAAVMAEVGDIPYALECYDRLTKQYPQQKKEIASAASDIVFRWVHRIIANNPDIPDADVEKLRALALTPRQAAPGESFLAARAENALGYFFLYLKKDPDSAAAIYQGLISSYPSTAFTNECCYRLASSLRQKGDTAGALALYRKVADEDKFGGYKGPAEYGAVGCYMSLGQETEAQAALGRMIAFGGDGDWHQMARIRLANLYAARKQYRDSLDLLSVARAYIQGKSGASGISSSVQSLSSATSSEELRRIDKMIEQVNELAAGQAN